MHYFDKATGRKSKKPPQFAKKGRRYRTSIVFLLITVEGQKIVALVETVQPVCVERFVDYPQLGRFTLRDEGRTIAIGKVRFNYSNLSVLNPELQITKLIENTAIDEITDGVANVSVNPI